MEWPQGAEGDLMEENEVGMKVAGQQHSGSRRFSERTFACACDFVRACGSCLRVVKLSYHAKILSLAQPYAYYKYTYAFRDFEIHMPRESRPLNILQPSDV